MATPNWAIITLGAKTTLSTGLIEFRKNHSFLNGGRFLTNEDIQWHGQEINKPLWDDPYHPVLAFSLKDPLTDNLLYAAFNPSEETRLIELPKLSQGKKWTTVVQTAETAPNDIFEKGLRPIVFSKRFSLPPYSALLLEPDSFPLDLSE